MPSYPSVPPADLDDRTADGADTDHRMKQPCPIPDEKCYPAARGTHVLVRPCVPEIPPYVLKAEAGVFASRRFFDELQIRYDGLAERYQFLRLGQRPCNPQRRGEVPSVAEQGKYGDRSPVVENGTFHPLDETSRRRFPKLLVSPDEFLPSDPSLFRLRIGQPGTCCLDGSLHRHINGPALSGKVRKNGKRGAECGRVFRCLCKMQGVDGRVLPVIERACHEPFRVLPKSRLRGRRPGE